MLYFNIYYINTLLYFSLYYKNILLYFNIYHTVFYYIITVFIIARVTRYGPLLAQALVHFLSWVAYVRHTKCTCMPSWLPVNFLSCNGAAFTDKLIYLRIEECSDGFITRRTKKETPKYRLSSLASEEMSSLEITFWGMFAMFCGINYAYLCSVSFACILLCLPSVEFNDGAFEDKRESVFCDKSRS